MRRSSPPKEPSKPLLVPVSSIARCRNACAIIEWSLYMAISARRAPQYYEVLCFHSREDYCLKEKGRVHLIRCRLWTHCPPFLFATGLYPVCLLYPVVQINLTLSSYIVPTFPQPLVSNTKPERITKTPHKRFYNRDIPLDYIQTHPQYPIRQIFSAIFLVPSFPNNHSRLVPTVKYPSQKVHEGTCPTHTCITTISTTHPHSPTAR